MLGSRKGIRDIRKASNDIKSESRKMKAAWTFDPAKKMGLLIEEHEARLKEADQARDKAYGWGAKKFIQVAERAEHEAAKVEREILKLQQQNPGIDPERVPQKRGRMDRFEIAVHENAETRRAWKSGEITREEFKARNRQTAKDQRKKRL